MTSRTVTERLFEAYAAEHHAELFSTLTRCEDGYLHEPTGLALFTRRNERCERIAIEQLGGQHWTLFFDSAPDTVDEFFEALAEAIIEEVAA